MDLKCPICGEPWDNDSLHDVVAEGEYDSYEDAYRDFIRGGCRLVFNNATCERDDNTDLRMAVADLMGDDSDGYISSIDDAEFLGLMD